MVTTKRAKMGVRTNMTERVSPYITPVNKKWLLREAKARQVPYSVVVNEALTKLRTRRR